MVITFSGTELESQWAPRTAPATLLRRPTDCSPCYAFNCPFEMQCLDIPAAEVAESALRMLEPADTVDNPRPGGAKDDFFFSSRRRHTIFDCDWSSDVCSSD